MRFIYKSTFVITMTLFSNSLFASDVQQNEANKDIEGAYVEEVVEKVGKRYTYQSQLLGEQRELLIHLPKNYRQDEGQYPVLYLLDGASHFTHAVLATEILHQSGKIPKTIIVAIPNNPGTRVRDAGKESNNFLTHIKREVIPYVDAEYRTSGQNILFGHSAMGRVTLLAFAKHTNMFDQYIAASPAVEHSSSELFNQLKLILTKQKLIDKSIYFSVGEKAREVAGFTDGAIYLSRLFRENAPKALSWHYEFMSEQNHSTTPYLTMFLGLGKIFNDYEAPAFNSFKGFKESGGMQELTDFFAKRGNKYQISKAVPQNKIVSLAFAFMDEGNFEQAIALLKQNSEKYDDQMQIYRALGEVYSQKKDKPQAIKAFEQALALAEAKKTVPGWSNYFREMISQLKLQKE
ncbi:alpha/beta hydrolase-fold protein [Colwelliaceae bacterium 6441]